MKKLIAATLLMALSAVAAAADFKPVLTGLDNIPLHSVPLLTVQKSLKLAQSKTAPLQFAIGAVMPLKMSDGVWTKIDNDTWSWRTRIFSANAETLNFVFAKFHMPAGGAMWIYDAAGQLVQGPYTSAQETPSGKLWTAVVMGDTAIIEARVPASVKNQMQIELARVNHGFRGFGKTGSGQESGSCNIDVACTQAAPWANEARSVARITIDGTLLCTGELLNNTNQDNDPLFITASHCEIGNNSIGTANSLPAASVTFYWNYVNNQCGGGSDTGLSQNQVGSTLVASDMGSDFTLLRLNQAPDQAFNVYFGGWTASATDVPQSGAVLHHPGGDVTKISFFSGNTSRVASAQEFDGFFNETRAVNVWQVRYTSGTTEEGSSGGAIYDQNHHIFGTLTGGESSCSNPSGFDYYGRFDLAWAANSSATAQLKAHLDPGNTGAMSFAGKFAYPPTVTISASPTTINLGQSSTITWSTSNVTSCTASGAWSGSQVTSGSVLQTPATTGSQNYTLTCTGLNGTTSNVASVSVNNADGSNAGGGGGGGALPPLTLASLGAFVLLRRRATSRRASSV